MNKIIVVLSLDDLLYKALQDNIDDTEINIIHIKNTQDASQFIENHHKATITIIDKWDSEVDFITRYSKYIFCFYPNKINHSSVFTAPVRLADLILEINKSIANDKLFHIINGNIYHELRSTIILPTETLRLTAKENMVIRELLLSEDFFISREALLQNIWKYSARSETNTIEACMNILRNKLPQGMVEQNKNGCRLNIKSFF